MQIVYTCHNVNRRKCKSDSVIQQFAAAGRRDWSDRVRNDTCGSLRRRNLLLLLLRQVRWRCVYFVLLRRRGARI